MILVDVNPLKGANSKLHIYRKINDRENNWAIIELQGDLQSNQTPLDNKCIGDLNYTKDGVPTLIIGSHLLTGKETDLAKPLVLLEKKCGDKTEYFIKTIIKKKLLFKTRPKPIVSI